MVAALWLCKKGMLGGMICLFEIVICIGRCSLKVCGEDSLMARLEHRLQPVVNYGIMPVFALANAGGAVAGLVAMRLACKPFREEDKDNSF